MVTRDSLLVMLGSGVGETAVAELRSWPLLLGLATTVICSCPPLGIELSLQLIGAPCVQEPPVASTETSLRSGDGVSVTVGVAAASGPWFVTVIVYVSGSSTRALAWFTVLTTARSALAGGGLGPGTAGPGLVAGLAAV